MANKIRAMAIRKYGQASNAMDNVNRHLTDLQSIYGEGYEEMYLAVETMKKNQLQLQTFLKEFRQKFI